MAKRIPRISIPLRKPEEVIPHLGKKYHWRQGYSAKAVADSWFLANDVPLKVRSVLNQNEQFLNAPLIDAWLERSTDLQDGRGSHSQTDLLAILGLGDSIAVCGVEAKVNESFGALVGDWLTEANDGKQQRLTKLCNLFGISQEEAKPLRYQLLHRTAAQIYEAQRYRTSSAIMMVHSFSDKSTGLNDFTAFAKALGFQGAGLDSLVGPRTFGAVDLWLCWTSDICPPPVDVLWDDLFAKLPIDDDFVAPEDLPPQERDFGFD